MALFMLVVVALLAMPVLVTLVALFRLSPRHGQALVAQLTPGVGLDPVTAGLTRLVLVQLYLAATIPVVRFATGGAYRIRRGYVSSVEGRFRTRFAVECVALVAPVWVVGVVVTGWWLDLPATPLAAGPVVALAVLALVLSPLQAAGEEYLFRGWLAQQVGAFVPRPTVALVAAVVVPAAASALAYGGQPWVLVTTGVVGLACGYLTWRTGGLEAAVAVRAVSTAALIGYALATDTLAGWFTGAAPAPDVRTTVAAMTMTAVAVAVVTWRARSAGVTRTWVPR